MNLRLGAVVGGGECLLDPPPEEMMPRIVVLAFAVFCFTPVAAHAQLSLHLSGGVPVGLGPEPVRTAFNEQFGVAWGGSYEVAASADVVATSRFNRFDGRVEEGKALRTWAMTAGPRVYFGDQTSQTVRPYFTTQMGAIHRQVESADEVDDAAWKLGVELATGVEMDVAPRTALFGELSGQATVDGKAEALHYGGFHVGIDLRF